MANLAPTNNSLNPSTQKKVQFQAFIKNDAVLTNISSTLGDQTRTKQFVASIISAVSTNPSLQECQAQTIVSAALLGEALKLSPSPQLGHYYLVPFKDNKNHVTNATFQLGYKGYIQLAIRSGQYKKMNVVAIKEGELINYNPLEEELNIELIDDEVERENRQTIGYYAMFELVNGFKKTLYWSKKKMETHALKYSKGYAAKKGYTFWEKDFDGMAYKTMLRQLISKWGIMSIDMQNAFSNDMAFRDSLDPNAQPTFIEQDDNVIVPEVIDVSAETLQPQEVVEQVQPQPTVQQPSLL